MHGQYLFNTVLLSYFTIHVTVNTDICKDDTAEPVPGGTPTQSSLLNTNSTSGSTSPSNSQGIA